MHKQRWRFAHFLFNTSLIVVSAVCLGCGNSAKEEEAVSRLKELGALVVPDINKRASSFVLPADPQKIEQALPLIPELRYLTSFGAVNTPMIGMVTRNTQTIATTRASDGRHFCRTLTPGTCPA